MDLHPTKRRTFWPEKPFADHERGAMFSATVCAYLLVVIFPLGAIVPAIHPTPGSLAARVLDSDWMMWPILLGYFPFAIWFRRAWMRLFRSKKPERAHDEHPLVVAADAEASAWASGVLDKRHNT